MDSMTGTQQSADSERISQAARVLESWSGRGSRIGSRLAACFALIVAVMIVADGLAVWQFTRTTTPVEHLAEADRISLSVLRIHLHVDRFRDNLESLAGTHDINRFTTEAASLREKFVEDVTQAQKLVESSTHALTDPAIRSALETLRGTLPSQIDTTMELASAADWPAVDLRISNQLHELIRLSSLLVQRVEHALSQQRAEAIESGQRATRQLAVILPMAALLTLLVAVVLGWYVTRSITDPLSELEAGARALAQGDFSHRVAIRGEDELAGLGRVLNDTAQRLAALYETLRSNEARFRLAIDTIPAYVWSSLPSGSVDFINQRWLDFSGLSLEQALDRGWEGALHSEDRAGLVEAWRGAIRSGRPMEYEARVRSADGQYRWLLIRNVPLRDDTGKVVKWYGTSTDIDDRKRAEQALRRSEAYLAETQRLTHTGTFAADPTTAPFYWSEELFRLFGFDPEQGVPTRDQPLERIHPEDFDRFRQAWERAIHEKVDSDVEYRIVLPDGTIRHVYGLGHPVLNANGELVEVVGTTVDITERKRAEAERERLRELEAELAHINRVSMMGELAASIAHEVNQPLTGIVSNGSACIRWLAGDAPNLEEAREAVRDIVRDGKRAGEVIARIRALTKRTAPPQEKLDLNETIREVLALIGHEAKKNNVVMWTGFADDVFPVLGDRVQLQQVVLNLVINAIEAMSGVGELARELVITTRNMDADQVQVTFEDSGPGLPPNAMSRIFDPFYTTKSGGMGMGLSISRSILQNHGGRLWVTANHRPGTSFHFSLPKYREELSYAAIVGV
jgi:PAS domain S-box-containing protein